LARFYADENFRYPIVVALRGLGHDVLTAREAGHAGARIDDDSVLAHANDVNRILLTQNRRDFIRRHNEVKPHCGIVVCTYDRDAQGVARRIDSAVTAQNPGRWLVRVNRPPA
jgi:hypothetical protein